MNKLFKRIAALSLGLAMAAGVGAALSSGAQQVQAAGGTFNKISSVAELVSGEKYLIVSEADNCAFDGSLNPIDAVANKKDVSISNGSITASEDFYFVITAKDGGYSIKGSNGLYIGSPSDSANELKSDASDKYTNTIEYNADQQCFVIRGVNSYLVFNNTKDQTRFRYYKPSTCNNGLGTGSYHKISLFKDEGGTPVTTYSVVDSVEHGSLNKSSVAEGSNLSVTISPDSGYSVPSEVQVTMGGEPVSFTYQNGVVGVQNVTDNVEIFGTCPAVPTPVPTDLPDGDYTASLAYANPIPSQISVLNANKSVVASLAVASEGVTYDASHKEYKINKGNYITFTNSTNAVIKSITVNVYRYKNFSVFVDGSSTETYKGDGSSGSGDPVVVAVDVNASSSVRVECNGGTGSYNQAIYSIDLSLRVGGEAVPVTGVEINPTAHDVIVAGTYQLAPVVSPSNADNKAVTYVSSNPNIASVNANGLVTGVAVGSCEITITTVDGGFTAKFTANVVSVNYGTASNPLTTDQAVTELTKVGGQNSPEKFYVYGVVSSSSYNKTYQDYTIWLQNSDGSVSQYFEIYQGSIPSPITEDDTQENALAGKTVLACGYGKVHNGTSVIYELLKVNNDKPTVEAYSPQPTKVLESISLSGNYPTVFTVGDQFSYEGLVVTAHYSDDSSAVVTPSSVSAPSMASAGEKTVTVQYAEGSVTVSAQYNITVNLPAPTLEKIEVSGQFKTEYLVGEQFDPTGIVVTAFYSDDSEIDVSANAQFSGFNSSVASDNVVVTVTYEDQSTTFVVFVSEPGPAVESIVVSGEYKTEYYVGEELDLSGLVVTAILETGFEEDVTDKAEFTGFDSSVPSESVEVIVSYQGQSTSFLVSVVTAPITDWTQAQKDAMAAKFEGYVVPFLGEECIDLAWNSTYQAFYTHPDDAQFVIAQRVFNILASEFEYAGTDDNGYYFTYDLSDGYVFAQLTPTGTQTHILFSYYLFPTEWDSDQVNAFAEILNGYVPTFNTLIRKIEWNAQYEQFVASLNGNYLEDAQNYFLSEEFEYDGAEQDSSGDYIYYYARYTEDDRGVIYWTVSHYEWNSKEYTDIGLYFYEFPVATSLAIDTTNAKVDYYVGEELDTTAVVVSVIDQFGEVMYEDVSEYCTFEADLSEAFDQVVVYVNCDAVSLTGTYTISVSVEPVEYTAEDFANDLLNYMDAVCANYNGHTDNKDALQRVWSIMMDNDHYGALSVEQREILANSASSEGGSAVERAMAFYDYVCGKYHLDQFIDGRVVRAMAITEEVNTTSNRGALITVAVVAFVAVTAIGVSVMLYRRKSVNIK